MTENGQPDLPTGWTGATLSDVCIKIQDGTHFSPKTQLPSGQYRYVTAKNVRPWGLDLSDVTYLLEADHRAIYRRCDARRGDVLLVKDGVNAGDAAINTLDEEISLLSSVCMLRPEPDVLTAGYLRHFLLSPVGYRSLAGQMTGTAIRRIILQRIKETAIPIAPLPEQRRIVAAIEEQFTRLDAAVASLKRAQANLKRYRAAALAAACSGRLVPTEAELARQEGRDFEHADQLLARVLHARRAQWEADELAKVQAKGSGPKDGRWKAKYAEPDPPDAFRLPELPEGWTWASVVQLTARSEYGTSVKCAYDASGLPVLRIPNIARGQLDLTDLKFATQPLRITQEDALRIGDILMCRTNGSIDLIGRTAVVRTSLDSVHTFASYLLRFRLVEPNVLPLWLHTYLDARQGRRFIEQHAASTAGQHNVSLTLVHSMPVPLPPIAEQKRVVAEVERRLSLIDELEVTVEHSLNRAERLRQAILKRAFEGKLVPQDPSDELVDVLLERIRAERERVQPNGRKATRRGRRAVKQLVMPLTGEDR